MKKIIAFILLTHLAVGQDKTSPLANLVKQALAYSPKIREQQTLINSGDIKKQILEANLKPSITAEAGYTRLDPIAKAVIPLPGAERELQFQPNNNYNTNISVGYLLYDWGKTKANITRITLEMNQQQHGINIQKTALAYQVANLYYGIVFLKKAIEVQKEELNLTNEIGKIVNKKIAQGDELEFNSLSGEIRSRQIENRIIEQQGQLERQYIYLGSLIGADAHALVPETVSLSDLEIRSNSESPFATASENSGELKSLRDKEILLQQDVALGNINGLPTLSSIAQLGVRNGFQPDINAWRLNSLLGIKLTVPIYIGKKGLYQSNLAKAQIEANKDAVNATKQVLNRDIDLALNDIKTANLKYEVGKRSITQAEYAMKLAKVRLENGVSTPLEIQSAEVGLAEAKFGQLQYEYQGVMAKIELNRLMGNKFW